MRSASPPQSWHNAELPMEIVRAGTIQLLFFSAIISLNFVSHSRREYPLLKASHDKILNSDSLVKFGLSGDIFLTDVTASPEFVVRVMIIVFGNIIKLASQPKSSESRWTFLTMREVCVPEIMRASAKSRRNFDILFRFSPLSIFFAMALL